MNVLGLLVSTIIFTSLLTGGKAFSAAASTATQSVAGGGVTVKVTYLNPKSNDGPRFQVMLDTHSVNLDVYDLKAIAVLRDESGTIYSPTSLENKGSGHHREAMVFFPKLATETKRLELVIKDVAGVKERTFRWEVD
jgi:hypothetical protein